MSISKEIKEKGFDDCKYDDIMAKMADGGPPNLVELVFDIYFKQNVLLNTK
jgi:hypothetical protein